MSEEKRDYPSWLDEELFDRVTEGQAPAAPDEEAAPPSPPPEAAAEEKPKKKKKKAAPAEENGGGGKSAPKKKAEAGAKGKKKAAAPAPKKEKTAEDREKGGDTPSGKDGEGKKKSAGAAAKEAAKEEKAAKGRRAARKWLVGLIVLVSLALILCVGATVCAYLISNSAAILPNVYVGGVYVGGMTESEALQALEAAKWDETRGGTLTVTLPEDVSFELDYLTAGAYEPKEEAVASAVAYGHSDDWFANLFTYAKGVVVPAELGRTTFTIDRAYVSEAVDKAVDEFESVTAGEEYTVNDEKATLDFVKGAGDVTLDRAAITDRCCELLLAGEHELEWTEIKGEPHLPDFAAIAADINKDVADAYYDPQQDKIMPEVKGVSLDAVKANELWKKAGVLEKVSVPISFIEPEITAASLEELLFRDQLGICETYLWGSSPNRISNIRLACSRFDGKVLTPGEYFSYNDVVGERTAEAGFKVAPTYSGTAHIDGLGGGICQVSSTLYNAALQANMEINERTCHTMLVGYLPAGLDATVDWPDTNFAFTNTSAYPIRIKAGVDESGRKLTIEIWGTNADGFRVEIMRGEWPAYDETYRTQYGLDVHVGYGAWTYRRIYDAEGNYVDEEKVYSYYHLPDDEIHWPVVDVGGDDAGDDGTEVVVDDGGGGDG